MTTRTVAVLGFTGIGLTAIVIQLRALSGAGSVPPVGTALGFLMRSRAGRVGVLLSWWWLGWHFFAR